MIDMLTQPKNVHMVSSVDLCGIYALSDRLQLHKAETSVAILKAIVKYAFFAIRSKSPNPVAQSIQSPLTLFLFSSSSVFSLPTIT